MVKNLVVQQRGIEEPKYNNIYSDSMIEMRIPSLNASETLEHAELLSCLHLHRKECQARTFVHKGLY